MAFSNSRFVPYAVRVAKASTWINQIETTPITPGVSLFEESSGSMTDRALVAARSIEPTVPIVTSDASILATLGFGGYAWDGSAATPVTIYGRELPMGAVPTAVASAVHMSATISDGLLVPSSLSASHNSVAKLNLMLHALQGSGGSSGATPVVIATGGTIPTTNSPEPATQNIYTCGVIHYTTGASSPAVSPRLVTGVLSLGVNFGIQVEKESTDGDVYPSFASIISRMPSIEFSCRDLTLAKEIGDGIATTAFDAYFYKVDPNGQRVAKASTVHIKISGTTGMLTPGGLNFTHKRPGETSFTFTPASAAPNLTISTSSAIPTTA